MDAAAVAVVAAALWSSNRRALTLYRKAITSLQNGDQVLRCRGSKCLSKLMIFIFCQP